MKILIISEAIAPVQEVASVRWTKIAKYIKMHHPDSYITVLTNRKDYDDSRGEIYYKRKDPLLEKEMIYFDNYWEIDDNVQIQGYNKIKSIFRIEREHYRASVRFQENMTIRNRIRKALGQVIVDTKMKIMANEMKAALKAKVFDFDVVISTCGPMWTHMVASNIKRHSPCIIWLADFRDFYANTSDSPSAYKRHKKYTMKYCASADAIIRVADILETFTPPNVPVYTIPNGFDPQEGREPQPPKKFSVVYTGILYGKRSDIGIAHKALCELYEEQKIDRSDIELIYAGPSEKTAELLVNDYHTKENFLQNLGMISRTKALGLQSSAAILLQAACNSEKEKALWTGKMYEYMMAKKPVLYVDSGSIPHSGPSKNIHHLGGYCYEQCRHEETWQGMKDYILEKYQEWKATGNVSVHQDKEYIEQYSYPHIAEQVWQLIQTQMERRTSDESTTA